MNITPQSDELVIFDELTGQYILTEEATLRDGMQLRARLSRKRDVDPTSIINALCRRVSNIIYNYLHKYSLNNMRQNMIIAQNAECKQIVYRAMLEQLAYLLMNGDLSRSVDIDKRRIAVDQSAKETLDTVIPSLGVPLTYQGVW